MELGDGDLTRVVEIVRAIEDGQERRSPLVLVDELTANHPERIKLKVVRRLWGNIPTEYRGASRDLQAMRQAIENLDQRLWGSVTYGAAHWVQDYPCHDHQCEASRCGCLEEKRRTHCFTCGLRLTSDGISLCCPTCEAAAMEQGLDDEDGI